MRKRVKKVVPGVAVLESDAWNPKDWGELRNWDDERDRRDCD